MKLFTRNAHKCLLKQVLMCFCEEIIKFFCRGRDVDVIKEIVENIMSFLNSTNQCRMFNYCLESQRLC